MEKNNSKINNLNELCPYCNNELPKVLVRKTKCLNCGKFVYVRTRRHVGGNRVLVKEQQIEHIEREWQNHRHTKNFKRLLKFGFGSLIDKKYLETKKELSQKFNQQPSETEILWELSNLLLAEFKNKEDWHNQKLIYLNQSLFLHNEGRDYIKVLQEAHKCDLREYTKNYSIKKVEIATCNENSCPACQKLSGKIFTIEQALKEIPIPEKNCSREASSKSKKGWCRCIFVPMIE